MDSADEEKKAEQAQRRKEAKERSKEKKKAEKRSGESKPKSSSKVYGMDFELVLTRLSAARYDFKIFLTVVSIFFPSCCLILALSLLLSPSSSSFPLLLSW